MTQLTQDFFLTKLMLMGDCAVSWSNAGRIRAYRINFRGDRRFKRQEVARFLTELNGQSNLWEEVMARR